jgi:hypothetical protein
MIILDTNVVSELMRPEPERAVAAWFEGLGSEALATTTITLAEIGFGLARLPAGPRRTRLEVGFAAFTEPEGPLPIMPFTAEAALAAGQWRAARDAAGQLVSFADAAIAGIVLTHGATLATRNTRDFAGLGAILIHPWAG